MCQVHNPLPKADAVVCDIDAFPFGVGDELVPSAQEHVGAAFAWRLLRKAHMDGGLTFAPIIQDNLNDARLQGLPK